MNSLLKPLDQYDVQERQPDLLVSVDEETDAGTPHPYKNHSSSQSSSRTHSIAESSISATPSENVLDTLTSGNLHKTGSETNGHTLNHHEANRPSARGSYYDGTPLENGHAVSPHPGDRITESGLYGYLRRLKRTFQRSTSSIHSRASQSLQTLYSSLPKPLQKALAQTWHFAKVVAQKIISCLNIPLSAIIISIIVAVTPPLKAFFFTPSTFISNSVTRAIQQSGNVAVPLILVVLGANLARNTLPSESAADVGTPAEQKKMLYLSLVCRMLVPTAMMAPLLALLAKYVPISILDDPIFVIVCFLLTGAPSSLQLAQMCQVNGVFVGVVSKLLFHSYVIWSVFPYCHFTFLVGLSSSRGHRLMGLAGFFRRPSCWSCSRSRWSSGPNELPCHSFSLRYPFTSCCVSARRPRFAGLHFARSTLGVSEVRLWRFSVAHHTLGRIGLRR